jgi:hypothetical protein
MTLSEYRKAAFRRPQQRKFPLARRWPMQYVQPRHAFELPRYLVLRGFFASEADANVAIVRAIATVLSDPTTATELLATIEDSNPAKLMIMRLSRGLRGEQR